MFRDGNGSAPLNRCLLNLRRQFASWQLQRVKSLKAQRRGILCKRKTTGRIEYFCCDARPKDEGQIEVRCGQNVVSATRETARTVDDETVSRIGCHRDYWRPRSGDVGISGIARRIGRPDAV